MGRRQRGNPSGPKSGRLLCEQQEAIPVEIIDFSSLDDCKIIGISAKNYKLITSRLEYRIHRQFALGSPRSELLFGLTRLNVIRALHANLNALGYEPTQMDDEAESNFSISGPKLFQINEAALPPALRPTLIQRSIPHHPWLDLIPIPKMRDNLILAGDSIDDVKLCHDICGNVASKLDAKRSAEAKGETGLIVWKDPWDPSGWEVTETFLQNWSWILRDCWDLFRSTNTWRRKRGERLLFSLASDVSQ
ncbi:hypothetical protein F1880_004832 [Penicillium rolfsii]|nr:hypothetical protein F1880_004832 [Penicillium rolfsii]